LVTTTDHEGDELEENLQDADILITTPFWSGYASREMIETASNLKLLLTAGVALTTLT
jgi:formate dehydrogenase